MGRVCCSPPSMTRDIRVVYRVITCDDWRTKLKLLVDSMQYDAIAGAPP